MHFLASEAERFFGVGPTRASNRFYLLDGEHGTASAVRFGHRGHIQLDIVAFIYGQTKSLVSAENLLGLIVHMVEKFIVGCRLWLLDLLLKNFLALTFLPPGRNTPLHKLLLVLLAD